MQHWTTEHRSADEARDRDLLSWGIKVLRYSNDSLRNNFSGVTVDILKNLSLEFSDLKHF